MCYSKHQKGYITSHEAKVTHFRTWKSGKKWLYGAAALTLAASSFSGVTLPFTQLKLAAPMTATAATTPANGALVAGQTADTGDHTYGSSDASQIGNWTPGGTTKANGSWLEFTETNSANNSTGFAFFNGSSNMSMSSGFTLSGNFKSTPTTVNLALSGLFSGGDGYGFFLTPASKAQMQANFNNAANPPAAADPAYGNPYTTPKGGGLGIAGLTNSVFVGRDLYNNTTGFGTGTTLGPLDGSPNGNQGTTGPAKNVSIRTTDGTGALLRTNYETTTVDNSGDGGVLGIGNNHITDKITMTWAPTGAPNAQGQVTGILTVTDQPIDDNGKNINSAATLKQTITVNSAMNIGAVGNVGGNVGQLSMNVSSISFNGQKGQEPVIVHYRNKVTGQDIMSPTTINANISDNIGIAGTASTSSPLQTSGNTYIFTPPAIPSGYTAVNYPAKITVQSFDGSTTTNPNVLYVDYVPAPQTVYWNYGHAFTSDGSPTTPPYPAVPSPQVGTTGTTITAPTLPAAPAGWSYVGVRYNGTYYFVTGAGGTTGFPNGTSGTYATMSAAMTAVIVAAGNTMGATSIGTGGQTSSQPANDNANGGAGGNAANNSFMIMLQANAQTANFNYGYVSTAQNTPTAPTVMTATGVTGSTVTAPTGYNSTHIPLGYYVSGIWKGTSATGTANWTGNASVPAAIPATETYGATGNSYYLQLTPFTVKSSLKVNVTGNDPADFNGVNGTPATTTNSKVTVGSPTPDGRQNAFGAYNNGQGFDWSSLDGVTYTDDVDFPGIRYIVTGYTLNGTTYKTWAALIAANPYIPAAASGAVAQAITMNMIYDGTSISSNPNSTATVGSDYKPATDITSGKDVDGSDDDNNPAVINGYDVVANIRSQDGTVNLWSDATKTINIAQGAYTETFYALNYLGLQAYQTQTTYSNVTDFIKNLSNANLQNYTVTSQTSLSIVKPFEVPFTGGTGMAGIVGLALAAGGTGFILKGRRKNEEEVKGGNQDEKNKK